MSDINWNETAVYEFMRFEREPERRVFPDRDITKLAKAGLIQENETGDWTLTQTGEDETIRALSAPLAEETDIDPLLDSLSDESAIQVLFNNPEWVKGKRAVRLWRRMGGENRRWIMSFMWDVPDSLIEESLAEPRNWQISSRLEEYKKALQTVARMERLFAKGSEIKRKMRARAGLSD